MKRPICKQVAQAGLRHDRDGLIRCRVCGCTDREPCAPPCSWAEGEADLCSTCAAAACVLVSWREGAHRPSWAALKREVDGEIACRSIRNKLDRLDAAARRADRRPYHGSAAEGNC